jgi:hypothetical protein
VFFVSFKIVNHGGRWGIVVQALTKWQHLLALHEARDALHQEMHPAFHRRIFMAIQIACV